MLRIFTLVGLLSFCQGLENHTFYPKSLTAPVPLKHNVAKMSRIVGGSATTIDQYPFSVSLQHEWEPYQYDTIHFCAASIINENWLLTTGQCADLIEWENVTVRVGSTYFQEGGTVHYIESYVIHPLFDYSDNQYDIALIKLNESLVYSDSVQPIQLPSSSYVIEDNTYFTMASWGAAYLFGDMVTQLQVLSLPTITNELCQTAYGDYITNVTFCAYQENTGMCIGDAGAAAVVDGVVIGIASWSYACATYGWPVVYTSLPILVDWVNEIAGTNSSSILCTPSLFSLLLTVIILMKIRH